MRRHALLVETLESRPDDADRVEALARHLAAARPDAPARVTLTDKYPNLKTFESIRSASNGLIDYARESIDARDVPAALAGMRTLFTAFHHFKDEDARAILGDAFAKRRCIVPASAWYEWTGEPGSKVKHRFARCDGRAIWFAGLWDRCATPDAGAITSFTILTGPSAGWLSDYHSRAPVILEDSEWAAWLDPTADATSLLSNARPERFEVSAPS